MASWFSKTVKDPYGTLNPEQRQVNSALGSTILNNMNDSYSYGGELSAGIDPGTQDVVDRNARINAVAENTYSNLGSYDDPTFNQNFNNEIADPSFNYFKQNIEPYLAQELPSFGTQRANVVARSLGDLQNNVLQQRFTAREAAKDRALRALEGSGSYMATAAGIQDIPRQIKQLGLDKAYSNFVQANQDKRSSLDQALRFLGIDTGTVEQEPTTFGNILNTAAQAAKIYGALQGVGSVAAPKTTVGDTGKTQSQILGYNTANYR